MKKLFILLVALFIGNLVNADVNQKVVELRITKVTQEEVVTTRLMKIQKKLPVDRHFICSGGFIDNHGDILTAKHCTEDADTIVIRTSDNQDYKAALVAVSASQDLAVIHIDRLKTPYFVFASSVTQGDEISTLGSPLGLTRTQSWGRVARLSGDLIFMDESVLPGNSGGIVFNKNEELIGCAVSVAIVGLGVTHLAQAQSLDSVVFFLSSIRQQLNNYSRLVFRASDR